MNPSIHVVFTALIFFSEDRVMNNDNNKYWIDINQHLASYFRLINILDVVGAALNQNQIDVCFNKDIYVAKIVLIECKHVQFMYKHIKKVIDFQTKSKCSFCKKTQTFLSFIEEKSV